MVVLAPEMFIFSRKNLSSLLMGIDLRPTAYHSGDYTTGLHLYPLEVELEIGFNVCRGC